MPKRLTISCVLFALALAAAPVVEAQQALPPSAAVKLAVRAVPGSEPLGVTRQGDVYVVRLKQDGTVVQVTVDAVTGEVSQQ